MSYGETIKDSLKILIFDEDALARVSNDEKATGYGFLTLAIAGIATAVSVLSPLNLIINPISSIIGLFVGYSFFHFIAKFLLGGQATGIQYFRALSNSSIVYWFTFVPFLGILLQILVGLYLIAVNIFILMKVHRLSAGKAVILGLLPLVLLFGLMFIGALAYFGMLSPDKFIPENCMIPGHPGHIDCNNFQITTDGTTVFTIDNSLGDENMMSVTATAENTCSPRSVEIYKGQEATFTCAGSPGTAGDIYRHGIVLNYLDQDGINKTVQGDLYLRYR